jgi:hypothetical protein
MRRGAAWLLLLAGAGRAEAHLGAVVAKATFSTPAGPTLTPLDGGYQVAPFTFTTVDTSIDITWSDGDTDPTGRFYFYYFDHQPAFQVQPNEIETLATPIPGGNGIWVSCTCTPTAGVVCPDAGSRAGMCANDLVWDTSAVPDGSYWIIAVNNDPPFHVYNTSDGPVRVVHGTDRPVPAVIVLRPDGNGSFDTSYRAQWLAVGDGPLTIDLAWGYNEFGLALNPPTPLAANLQPPLTADGTQFYDWNVSQLMNMELYYLRVRATDGNGRSAFSDSRLGLNVFHPPPDLSTDDGGILLRVDDLAASDLAVPVDAGRPHAAASGCEVPSGNVAGAVLMVPAGLALALVLLLVARRR